ncbi:hypothetical protein Tco_0000861 [Tanacetum coccineum]
MIIQTHPGWEQNQRTHGALSTPKRTLVVAATAKRTLAVMLRTTKHPLLPLNPTHPYGSLRGEEVEWRWRDGGAVVVTTVEAVKVALVGWGWDRW